MENEMYIQMRSVPQNEAMARTFVGAFATALNPTLDVLSDIKTAVSEAVTNAIVHGYEGRDDGFVELGLKLNNKTLTVVIKDRGRGISDLPQCLEMFYTTKGDDERSGMGFTIMKTFMDSFHIASEPGNGTTVTLTKTVL